MAAPSLSVGSSTAMVFSPRPEHLEAAVYHRAVGSPSCPTTSRTKPLDRDGQGHDVEPADIACGIIGQCCAGNGKTCFLERFHRDAGFPATGVHISVRRTTDRMPSCSSVWPEQHLRNISIAHQETGLGRSAGEYPTQADDHQIAKGRADPSVPTKNEEISGIGWIAHIAERDGRGAPEFKHALSTAGRGVEPSPSVHRQKRRRVYLQP